MKRGPDGGVTALVVVNWHRLTPLTQGGRAVTFTHVDAARDLLDTVPDRSAWGVVSVPMDRLSDVGEWLTEWLAGAEARYQAAIPEPLELEAVPA